MPSVQSREKSTKDQSSSYNLQLYHTQSSQVLLNTRKVDEKLHLLKGFNEIGRNAASRLAQTNQAQVLDSVSQVRNSRSPPLRAQYAKTKPSPSSSSKKAYHAQLPRPPHNSTQKLGGNGDSLPKLTSPRMLGAYMASMKPSSSTHSLAAASGGGLMDAKRSPIKVLEQLNSMAPPHRRQDGTVSRHVPSSRMLVTQ